VRRHYQHWRKRHSLPDRCDNQQCRFFTALLEWNGAPLPLILDHVDGNRRNNSTGNLRFLCPHCDAQLLTRGGQNVGRIQNQHETGYEVAHRDGHRDANVFPHGVGAKASVGVPSARSSWLGRRGIPQIVSVTPQRRCEVVNAIVLIILLSACGRVLPVARHTSSVSDLQAYAAARGRPP
jgi:hypothetical protein